MCALSGIARSGLIIFKPCELLEGGWDEHGAKIVMSIICTYIVSFVVEGKKTRYREGGPE